MGDPGPALGLDFGTRRIGLALSDAEGRFAFPAGALERRGLEQDLAALAALVEERGVRQLVLGLPLHMDGRAGDMAEMVRDFARQLEAATGLPVALVDERWTSREAERSLRDLGEKRGRRSAGAGAKRRRAQRGAAERSAGRTDEVAATLLLRTWLERSGR